MRSPFSRAPAEARELCDQRRPPSAGTVDRVGVARGAPRRANSGWRARAGGARTRGALACAAVADKKKSAGQALSNFGSRTKSVYLEPPRFGSVVLDELSVLPEVSFEVDVLLEPDVAGMLLPELLVLLSS